MTIDSQETGHTLQRHKAVKRFQLMDVDQDGHITRADYENLIQRLLDAYPAQQGTPAADRLRQSYLKLWRALAYSSDADGDGKVTQEEFVNAVISGLVNRSGGFDRAIKPVAQAVLELADSDGTQTLSLPEFTKLFETFGVSAEEAGQSFKALDVNGDGQLTSEEIIAANHAFYLSDSPADPANLLFGRYSAEPT
ncbi:EF-hand domain-containing protein [Nonomuraea sp. MTCD27]|uniref:EF-hand domain-containing protein n=1 Tax=Nonomuraea sp. MTCD27 TaxID=1676747 RepID=UPI0035BED0F4